MTGEMTGVSILNERIRVASPEDAEAILKIYGPFCLPDAPASFEVEVPTLEDIRSRITHTLSTMPWIVYEVDGQVVGYASAHPYAVRAAYKWSVTASIYLNADARGRGVGKKLYTKLFALLRQLGYFNVYAGITVPNEASIALHKSMGFKEVAYTPRVGYKGGAWHDVTLLWLELQPHTADPAEPLKFIASSF